MTALPEDVRDEPLRRYKLAVVRGTPPRLHPIGRYRRRSYEYLEPRRAVCHRRGHRAPAVDCTCGFHAVEQIDQLPRVTTVLADSVVLAVDLGGTIIEHERGVRAEEQAVLGVGFPARCHRCGEQATVVVPGRLWRSACAGCAARLGGLALSRSEATAQLGVDVEFVDVPDEPSRLHRWGVLRSLGLSLLSISLVVVSLLGHAAAAGIAITAAGAAASLAVTVATVTAGSARSHSDWFVVQCACLTVASLGLRAVGRA